MQKFLPVLTRFVVKGMDDFILKLPPQISFGISSLKKGASLLREKRVLLVLDPALSAVGIEDSVKKIFEREKAQVLLYSDIRSDSSSEKADEISDLAQTGRAEALIGIGGIRTLNAAKTAAYLCGSGLRTDDIIDGALPDSRGLAYIEIPAAGRNPFMMRETLLLLDGRNRNTVLIEAPGSLPEMVLIDPSIGTTLTRRLLLSTLLDTFLFALEGYISVNGTFYSDTLLLRSIAAALTAIPKAEKTSVPMADLAYSASEAGFFCALGLSVSGTGPWSALAFALNGLTGIPKSFCAVPFIPEILEYGKHAAPYKISRMASILGIDSGSPTVEEAAEKVIDSFRITLGIHHLPGRLKDLTIGGEVIERAAASAYSTGLAGRIPRPLSRANLEELLKQVL